MGWGGGEAEALGDSIGRPGLSLTSIGFGFTPLALQDLPFVQVALSNLEGNLSRYSASCAMKTTTGTGGRSAHEEEQGGSVSQLSKSSQWQTHYSVV